VEKKNKDHGESGLALEKVKSAKKSRSDFTKKQRVIRIKGRGYKQRERELNFDWERYGKAYQTRKGQRGKKLPT